MVVVVETNFSVQLWSKLNNIFLGLSPFRIAWFAYRMSKKVLVSFPNKFVKKTSIIYIP